MVGSFRNATDKVCIDEHTRYSPARLPHGRVQCASLLLNFLQKVGLLAPALNRVLATYTTQGLWLHKTTDVGTGMPCWTHSITIAHRIDQLPHLQINLVLLARTVPSLL